MSATCPVCGDDREHCKYDVVDSAGIAERLSVKRETVHMWRYRKLLPEPTQILNAGPVWKWSAIEDWANSTGRL